jgi:hypothetical protein
MSSNQKRLPFPLHRRQEGGALPGSFGTVLRAWLRRLAAGISPANARRSRRQMRYWLKANGLTIVLVCVMMVVAWMVAER